MNIAIKRPLAAYCSTAGRLYALAVSLTVASSVAEAAILPLARLTEVDRKTVNCSLSCGAGQMPSTVSEYHDSFTNAQLDPLLNSYDKVYQKSNFTADEIYASTSGSAASGRYGQFGHEDYSSRFSLIFSLATPHEFQLNGQLAATWAGLSKGPVYVSLKGPLTEYFSIPVDSHPSANTIQMPIFDSGVMPAGVYTLELAVSGSANVIESSSLKAEATLDLVAVPLPGALPLLLGAIGTLRIISRQRA